MRKLINAFSLLPFHLHWKNKDVMDLSSNSQCQMRNFKTSKIQ